MNAPRRGSLVAFPLHGRMEYAMIHAWSGNADSLALLVSEQHRVYFRFPDLDAVIDPVAQALMTKDHAESICNDLTAWLLTKAGRQVIRDARGPVEATVDTHGRVTKREVMPLAGGGTGYPHFSDPPGKLHASNYPAWLSERFTRYLYLRPKYEATLERLAERNPKHYAVYVEHVHGGRRLTEIAASLGITPVNARYRQHRARVFVASSLKREADA